MQPPIPSLVRTLTADGRTEGLTDDAVHFLGFFFTRQSSSCFMSVAGTHAGRGTSSSIIYDRPLLSQRVALILLSHSRYIRYGTAFPPTRPE